MTLLIIICVCLLLAYFFEVTSATTRIPSVILLLLVGWIIHEMTLFFEIEVPDLTESLTILGTVGLILIVLEGSLELEFNKSKSRLIKDSFISALVPLLISTLIISGIFMLAGDYSFNKCLINSIPLSVISSAIAIPTAKYLRQDNKEFVIYESSLSDILGVLLFNFFAVNTLFKVESIFVFIGQLVLVIILSALATLMLAYLLKKIQHPIKFLPIIILIILIYAISKVFHLPGLIFILILGIFLGNLDELKNIKLLNFADPVQLDQEVKKFKELTIEFTFMVRSIFFLLFGFLIETANLINPNTLVLTIIVLIIIYVTRYLQLKFLKRDVNPLLFIAPRGLITILLFLSIEPGDTLPFVNKALLIQVIIVSALIMMYGMMSNKAPKNEPIPF